MTDFFLKNNTGKLRTCLLLEFYRFRTLAVKLGKIDIIYLNHLNTKGSNKSYSILSPCRRDPSLQWRHNRRDGVSNHQPNYCLLNCLFGRRWKKHRSSALLAFVRGIYRWPANSPHKGLVTRKMFPFDDVIMIIFRMHVTGVPLTIKMPGFRASGWHFGNTSQNCSSKIRQKNALSVNNMLP